MQREVLRQRLSAGRSSDVVSFLARFPDVPTNSHLSSNSGGSMLVEKRRIVDIFAYLLEKKMFSEVKARDLQPLPFLSVTGPRYAIISLLSDDESPFAQDDITLNANVELSLDVKTDQLLHRQPNSDRQD